MRIPSLVDQTAESRTFSMLRLSMMITIVYALVSARANKDKNMTCRFADGVAASQVNDDNHMHDWFLMPKHAKYNFDVLSS